MLMTLWGQNTDMKTKHMWYKCPQNRQQEEDLAASSIKRLYVMMMMSPGLVLCCRGVWISTDTLKQLCPE